MDTPGGTPGKTPGPVGIALRLIVFGASMALVLALFRAVASPDGGGLVGSKLEYFEENAERFDTVFLGSSHVYRSFLPEAFDERMAEAGLETSSFNFGVQLPSLFEDHYLMRRLIDLAEQSPGGKLERVFVEYQILTPQIDPINTFIPRSIYWHDCIETQAAIETVFEVAEERAGKIHVAPSNKAPFSVLTLVGRQFPATWRLTTEHVQHYFYRSLMVGRGKDVGRGLLGRSHGQVADMDKAAGYLSLEAEEARLTRQGRTTSQNNMFLRRRESFQENLSAYDFQVRALLENEVWFGDAEWMNGDLVRTAGLGLIRRMADDAREAGVELVLVMMPGNSCNRPVEERMEAELGITVLRYNRPDLYPELYAVENRYDSGHPTEEAARLFTELFAADYLAARSPSNEDTED